MEDIRDPQPRRRRHFGNLLEYDREFGARNHSVLHDVVRRKTACRRKGCFAALPDEYPLLFALGQTIFPGAVPFTQIADLLHLQANLNGGAIQLDQQQRFALGIVRVHGGFGGLDGEAVHNLHRRRQNGGGNDIRDGLSRG